MTRNFGAKLRFVKSRPWAGRQRHKPQTPAGIGALGLPHTGLIWAKAYVGIPGATQVTTGSTHPPPQAGGHLRGMASLGWALYGMNGRTSGPVTLGDRQASGLSADGQARGPCRGRRSFLSSGIRGMGSKHPASSRTGKDRSASVKCPGTTERLRAGLRPLASSVLRE